MRPLILSAAALCLAASPASAQSTEQRYQGTLFILTATAQCADTVAQVGRAFIFNLRTQSNRQVFTLTDAPNTIAVAATAANGRFGASGTYAATKIGGGGGVSEFSGPYSSFVFTPASFGNNTASAQLTGTLRNFDDTTGCNITVRAAGARKPEPF